LVFKVDMMIEVDNLCLHAINLLAASSASELAIRDGKWLKELALPFARMLLT
jgi:hypothetical protein